MFSGSVVVDLITNDALINGRGSVQPYLIGSIPHLYFYFMSVETPVRLRRKETSEPKTQFKKTYQL